MASSHPPALRQSDSDFHEAETLTEFPRGSESGLRLTEGFVREYLSTARPVRVQLGKIMKVRDAFVEEEDASLFPSESILAKLSQSTSPEDFLEVIDMMFEQDARHLGSKKPGNDRF